MNQLKHIVYSLPRHAPPSNAISGVPSGYQIHAPSVFRSGSDFLSRGLRSRSCAGYGGKNDAQTLSLAKQTVTLTRYRNASTDRVGNSNVPFPANATSSDDKKMSKAEVSSKNEAQVPQLMAVPEPRKYAKMIADYSAAIEKQNLNSKSKELPTGLLSRLPIESLVSSLRSFEKRPRSKLAKRSSVSVAAKSNADQSKHALTKNTLKSESSKSLASVNNAPQKRDYFTKNYDSDQFFNVDKQSGDSKSKSADDQNQCTDSVLMKSTHVPNDFDVICDLTAKYDKRTNNYTEWSNSGGIDHKVKAPSNLVHDLELLNPNSDNNQCQFHIVASKEKIELKQSSSVSKVSRTGQQKSNRTNSQQNTGLPWWAIPEPTLDEKYEKAENTSTPDIKVIYSEEMPDVEITRQNDKTSSLSNKSKLKRPEKLASISKTKQYIKEELEKHKNKQKQKKDKLTNIDGKEADEGKRRPINEKSSDKTAKLSKMMDVRAASKKSGQDNAGAIPEARKRLRQRQAWKSPIDQGYRVKRVTEPLKPLEKRKDGTLIDYGLKVPTRRPKNQQPQPGEPQPENKKNSAARKITASGQQSLLQPLRKSGENPKNNNSIQVELTTSDCSGEAITAAERLVNSPRCEQTFGQPPRAGCRGNCRPSTCALESAMSERPEKRLIYAAWLNERRAPGAFC